MPTPPLHLALIPGHGWRWRDDGRGVRRDPGAVGLVEEAAVVRQLAGLVFALAPDRVSVHDAPGPAGPGLLYRERHAAALAAIGRSPGLVVHLHVNAGGGRYAAGFYDPRSQRGARAVARLSVALAAERSREPALLGLSACQRNAAHRPGWDNVANLVEPSWSAPGNVSAILIETAFADQPRHAPVFTVAGLQAWARAIVAIDL